MLLRVPVLVAIAVLGALAVGGDAAPTTRQDLVREAARLVPGGTPILGRTYRPACNGILGLRSPPCISLRLGAGGSVERRADELVGRLGDGWQVERADHRDGIDLSFRRGDIRARAYLQTIESREWCRSSPTLVRTTCADLLVIEKGPPAERVRIVVPPPSLDYERPYDLGARKVIEVGSVNRRGQRP